MNRYNKQGFTLIELMLAMAFVSALLVAIAMTVIQIGKSYNRGITYKNVNTAGSVLSSELQRAISSSAQFDINATGNNARYINNGAGGRLCIGQYSYIWNFGSAIKSSSADLNKYSDSTKTINFVKVPDPSFGYCIDATSKITSTDAIELLNAGENDLAIHSFLISSDSSAYDSGTGQRLYSISFLIGTNEQQALDGSYDSTTCKTANDINSNPTYCAVNQFDIVARAGKKVM